MVMLQTLVELLNRSKGRILNKIELLGLPEQQHKAVRREILNILGKEGLERDLAKLIANEGQQVGRGRNGRE